jgi:hypothetical protein
MERVTLRGLFEELDGRKFPTRQQLAEAVLEVFNRHLTELPVGYSYMDAIEGARAEGWLHTNGDGHGVKVSVSEPLATVG